MLTDVHLRVVSNSQFIDKGILHFSRFSALLRPIPFVAFRRCRKGEPSAAECTLEPVPYSRFQMNQHDGTDHYLRGLPPAESWAHFRVVCAGMPRLHNVTGSRGPGPFGIVVLAKVEVGADPACARPDFALNRSSWFNIKQGYAWRHFKAIFGSVSLTVLHGCLRFEYVSNAGLLTRSGA